MNNNVRALKSGIWYTVSTFLLRGLTILTTPIFTRILSKTDFGLFSNYVSWREIFYLLVTLSVESSVVSARYDYEEKFDEYIYSMVILSTVLCVLWSSVLNIFNDFFNDFFGISQCYINIMLLYILFSVPIRMFQLRERYMYEYKKTVYTSMGVSIGTVLLSIILVLGFDDKLKGRILGASIPTILLGALFYMYFYKRAHKLNTTYWGYALKICLPCIPHTLSLTILNSSDRVMINNWCGAEDTALYSLAYSCGAVVTMLETSLNSAFNPWLAEKMKHKEYREIQSFTKKYAISFMAVAVGFMLVAPEVLWIFGGSSYIGAKYVITPVAMGCICQFLYTLYVMVEYIEKKTYGMAVASVCAMLINVVLNYIFIPRIGYLAAAYTTLFGYFCLLLMHMYMVHRLGLGNIYDNKFIIASVLVCFCISVGITILYDYAIVRYAVTVVYFGFFIWIILKQRKHILKIFKR
jgi:O-antigen/teichoic acid export membrane protein